MPSLADLPLHQVPVVEPSTSLEEAVQLLKEEPLRTVVIVGDEQFFGVFNEDALRSNLVPPGANLALLQVGPYLHPVRAVGKAEMTPEEALALADRRGVTVLPVVRNHTYLGVITRADLEAAQPG